VRYGRETLGASEGFFAQLVDVVVKTFGDFFPELVKSRDTIHSVIAEEEASFSRTLVKGIERFKKAAAGATGGVLSGQEVISQGSDSYPASGTCIYWQRSAIVRPR
jgi:alanyl-tRNA synthetase